MFSKTRCIVTPVSWVFHSLFPSHTPGRQLGDGLNSCAHAQCEHLLCFVATQNLLESLLLGDFPTI